MPWSSRRYPDSMKNLDTRVRVKAIHIANSLLKEGQDEGLAIRIGIVKAREYFERRSRS